MRILVLILIALFAVIPASFAAPLTFDFTYANSVQGWSAVG